MNRRNFLKGIAALPLVGVASGAHITPTDEAERIGQREPVRMEEKGMSFEEFEHFILNNISRTLSVTVDSLRADINGSFLKF